MSKTTKKNLSHLSKLDWGLVAAAGIGIVAVWLTVAGGLPFGHDSVRHLYRLVEREYLARDGYFFTRWSPFFGYGFGYPLYNYYQPLFDYLALPFVLIDISPLVAMRIVLGFAIVAGAIGAYCWIAAVFDRPAGIVGATAYVFSPYFLYTLLNRAGFPEILSLAIMPWSLWVIYHYIHNQRLRYGAFLAVLIAALMLAHLYSAYIFIASVSIYVLGLALLPRFAQKRVVTLFNSIWPFAAGAGLAAFFWLPAVLETSLIQIERILEISDPSTGDGLLAFWQVFSGPIWPGANNFAATVSPRLSWFAAVLAVSGAFVGWVAIQSTVPKVHILIGVVIVLSCVLMLTPLSIWVWQGLPMLRLGAFPFRFLGVASLWLSLLAGIGCSTIVSLFDQSTVSGRMLRISVICLICLGLSLYTSRWSYVAYHPKDTLTDLPTALKIENESQEMGLMPRSELTPHTVKELPPMETWSKLEAPKLMEESLPDDIEIVSAEYDLFRYELTFNSTQPFQAEFATFYFPSWKATLNDQPVAIEATVPYGFMSVPIRQGNQQLSIYLDSTFIQKYASYLSLLSLVILISVFGADFRARKS